MNTTARSVARLVLLPAVLAAVALTGCEQVPSTRDVRGGQAAAAPADQALAPQTPPREADPDDAESDRAEISRLDPALRAAVRDTAAAARADGVPFEVTSGWRSRAHQQRLLDEAVARYGSMVEALRWVATPDGSAHVTGDAVDIGPRVADDWLERHGARWGLCRIFANEPWHFELATDPGGTCPALIPDSSFR